MYNMPHTYPNEIDENTAAVRSLHTVFPGNKKALN